MALELFATATCPSCAELRDHLEWEGRSYVEYDVEVDAEARARLAQLTGSTAMVPVLVEEGEVKQVGWRGRGCYIGLT
jgi:glutaredoxin 3